MAKKSLTVGQLVAQGAKLQSVSNKLQRDENISSLAEAIYKALDELVLYLLRQHRQEMILQVDHRERRRLPLGMNYYAVLEISSGKHKVRIPIPRLLDLDDRLAKEVVKQLERGHSLVYSVEWRYLEDLGRLDVSTLCRCGHEGILHATQRWRAVYNSTDGFHVSVNSEVVNFEPCVVEGCPCQQFAHWGT